MATEDNAIKKGIQARSEESLCIDNSSKQIRTAGEAMVETLQANINALSIKTENIPHIKIDTTKTSFLELPGEIRNAVYRQIFPTPQNPQVIRIDLAYQWPFPGTKTNDEQQFSLGIYRTCKKINQEIPSLEYLLSIGALIPTATLKALSHIWIHPAVCSQLAGMILPATQRLRIRSDIPLDRNEGMSPNVDHMLGYVQGHRQMADWLHSGRMYYFMRAFFDGASHLEPAPYGAPSDTHDSKVYTAKHLPREKTLEISCGWRNDKFDFGHVLLLMPLLEAMGQKPLLDNALPVQLRMRGELYEPEKFKKLNEEVLDWMRQKFGDTGHQSMNRAEAAHSGGNGGFKRGDEM
ncbi:hypothetical protein MMC10_003992 [Thelotrema lepadinum]|nr:hypothetical protein [Thelotrema lepadinum]